MTSGPTIVLYPVKDVEAAKAVYTTLLGSDPYVDQPYYVGYRSGEQEIGLVPGGHDQGLTGPVPYFEVTDISAALTALTASGAEVTQQPRDVGGGMLVASFTDGDGNTTGLRQPPA